MTWPTDRKTEMKICYDEQGFNQYGWMNSGKIFVSLNDWCLIKRILKEELYG